MNMLKRLSGDDLVYIVFVVCAFGSWTIASVCGK